MSPRPIVVYGKNPEIAKAVRKYMLPEYDVIHICIGKEAGAADIPLLLSGRAPKDGTNLGSQNYVHAPIAIAAGGGFDDESFKFMKQACEGIQRLKAVPWLRPDVTKARPGQAEVADGVDGYTDNYGKGTADRVKECLARKDVHGNGVFLY